MVVRMVQVNVQFCSAGPKPCWSPGWVNFCHEASCAALLGRLTTDVVGTTCHSSSFTASSFFRTLRPPRINIKHLHQVIAVRSGGSWYVLEFFNVEVNLGMPTHCPKPNFCTTPESYRLRWVGVSFTAISAVHGWVKIDFNAMSGVPWAGWD